MQKRKLERLRFDQQVDTNQPKVSLNWSLTIKGSLGTCQSSNNGSTNGNGEFGNCSRPPIPSDLEISCSSGGFQDKVYKFLHDLLLGSPTCSIGCPSGSVLTGGNVVSLKCDCNKKNKCKWKTDRNKKVKASAFSNYRCSNNLITTSKISTTTKSSTAQTTTDSTQSFQKPKILALHGGGGSASSLSQGFILQ